MQDGIEEGLIALIGRESGLNPARISKESRLVQDLGVDGDDAIDLLLKIAKRHGTDLSGFDYSLYFRPEPSLLSIFRRRRPPEKELTVGELAMAIQKGSLPSS